MIEAARGGDVAALDRLLSASQPDLMRFARRTCSTTEDAEDAVQVALWQLHRRIGTLRVTAVAISFAMASMTWCARQGPKAPAFAPRVTSPLGASRNGSIVSIAPEARSSR